MHLMELYASIKNLKQEEEEMNLNRQRLCTYLRKDLLQFHQEVCEETEGTTASAVVKDLIDQLANLNKRLLDIRVMGESEPNIPPLPFSQSTTHWMGPSEILTFQLVNLFKK